MSPTALIRLEAELEYGVPIHSESIPISPSNRLEVPRVTVARCGSGYLRLLRADLSTAERTIFDAFDPPDLFAALSSAEPFEVLGAARMVHCCWYCISRIPDPAEFADVVRREGQFVIERNGEIAARAWAAQEDNCASEVEVETAEAFRRHGFGRQVVAAWAHHVRRDGKVALYSHLVTNDASRALAESLGAWKFAETRELF